MRWSGRGLWPLMLALTLVATILLPRAAHADGVWLDDDAVTWNQPGMAIPRPLESTWTGDARCDQQLRPAESDEDRAVEAAGWKLFASYVGGWNIRIVRGLAGYDGMCRPMEYQAFVFVEGQLAGTLSPTPMGSRLDGALTQLDFYSPDRLVAGYVRYTDQDALCCPSARSTVTFKILRSERGPVLIRERTATEPTSAAAVPASAPTPAASPVPAAPAPPAAAAPAATTGRVHVVQAGDSLGRIAQQYGVTVDAILEANDFTDRNRVIRIGERLLIPDP